jgi:predicted DNA-binding protein
VGRNKPVTWEDDIMKGEIIECGIESVHDYESTADVLNAVA